MLRLRAGKKLFVALMWTSATLLACPAFAQSDPGQQESRKQQAGALAQQPRLGNAELTASDPQRSQPENDATAGVVRASNLKSEVDTLKAENALVRDLLRKMEEQQQHS